MVDPIKIIKKIKEPFHNFKLNHLFLCKISQNVFGIELTIVKACIQCSGCIGARMKSFWRLLIARIAQTTLAQRHAHLKHALLVYARVARTTWQHFIELVRVSRVDRKVNALAQSDTFLFVKRILSNKN